MFSLDSIFSKIARFSSRNYRILLLISVILSISSALTIKNLSFDSDVLNLLPEGNEFTKTFRETYEEFGSFDQVILMVTVPENKGWNLYTSFVENLSLTLLQKNTISGVEYKIPDLSTFFKSMFRKGLLFLSPREFELFKGKLSDSALRKQIKKNT